MADGDTVASKFTKEVKYKTKALGRFGFSCNGLTSHESSPDVGGWEPQCWGRRTDHMT